MACLLSTNNITLEYPTKLVLDRVSLGIDEGDRIGVVGRNGDGKSSLLSVLCGNVEPDSGMVVRNGTPTIGVLGQSDSLDDNALASEQIGLGGDIPWEAERKPREIVAALLEGVDLDRQVKTLSGGQRRRLDLARLLMGNWDVLILDEPTNHLDIRAINWLASHLKSRWQPGNGALIVVTHDRWFLDEVCNRMWEVHSGKVAPFEGGYSAYVMQRVERARLEEQARRKRENLLRKELAWLSRGAQARRSKPKFHLEQAAALIADEPPLRNALELKRTAMTRLGKQVLELENVCVDLGGKRILHDISWIVGPGDRIGILGENGAGKTTLLKLLAGKTAPSSGRIKTGKTVKLATLTQGLEELEDVEGDVVRVVCSRYKTFYEVDGKMLSPTALLERLGFSRDELNARCCDLSGGQRRRFQLMLTLLEEPNVLLLDEPGNDLDTDMMAAMEDLLDSWPGTLLVVSHDRNLIERVTDNQYALIDGRFLHVPGGIDEYLSVLGKDGRKPEAPEGADNNKAPKQSAAQAREIRKTIASLERKMETQRKRVNDAEEALRTCDPCDFVALGEAQSTVDEAKMRLTELEDAWLESSLELQ